MANQKLSGSLLSLLAVPLVAGLALLPLSPVKSVTFQPQGSPQKTAAGGARGICSPSGVATTLPKPAIAALIPQTEVERVAAAYPTILVRIPESHSLKAELSLWDENSNGIYQTMIILTGTPGIVSLKVPSDAPSLESGKRYKWSVAIVCDAAQRQRDVVVEGWLQRNELSASLSSQIEGADPLQKAKLYAQNGFWYDTVATLAVLKRSRPEDPRIAAEWQELLQSVGLSEHGQAPLVNCCQAPN